jgi:hypothetical protein
MTPPLRTACQTGAGGGGGRSQGMCPEKASESTTGQDAPPHPRQHTHAAPPPVVAVTCACMQLVRGPGCVSGAHSLWDDAVEAQGGVPNDGAHALVTRRLDDLHTSLRACAFSKRTHSGAHWATASYVPGDHKRARDPGQESLCERQQLVSTHLLGDFGELEKGHHDGIHHALKLLLQRHRQLRDGHACHFGHL